MEALLGGLLNNDDPRAQALLEEWVKSLGSDWDLDWRIMYHELTVLFPISDFPFVSLSLPSPSGTDRVMLEWTTHTQTRRRH